jgi:hypothetical protein
MVMRKDCTKPQATMSSNGSSVSEPPAQQSNWKHDVERILAYYERIEPLDKPAKTELTPEYIGSNNPCYRDWYRHLYRSSSDVISLNMDICFRALCSGCTALDDVPPSIQTSVEFWQRFVSVCPEGWSPISLETTRIEQLVWLLETIPTVAAAEEMFELVPNSRFDRDIWLKIVQSPSFVWSHLKFLKMAPDFVWHDKELVVLAVSQTDLILECVPPWFPFSTDREFVVAALSNSPDSLYYLMLSDEALAMYPDLVATAIRRYDPNKFANLETLLWLLYDTIDMSSLWHEKQVVHAWLAQGGDYLHDKFLPEMKHDEQAFLLIAEHNPKDFWCAADELCTSKEYLTRVLNVNPHLFKDLPTPELAKDYDLALVALVGSSLSSSTTSAEVEQKRADLIGSYDESDRDVFWTEFAAWVRNQVSFPIILDGIMTLASSSGSNESSCPLGMLNQGDSTTLMFGQLLAELIGIPMTQDLGALRRALAALAIWGY